MKHSYQKKSFSKDRLKLIKDNPVKLKLIKDNPVKLKLINYEENKKSKLSTENENENENENETIKVIYLATSAGSSFSSATEFTPLKFWFNEEQDDIEKRKEEFFKSEDYINFQINLLYGMYFMGIKKLSQFKEKTYELQRKYLNEVCRIRGFFSLGTIAFDDEIELINKMIYKISSPYYKVPVRFKEDSEIINDFKVPSYANKFKVPYDVYLEWKEIWDDKTEMTLEEFKSNFAEGSYEKENAWDLTENENITELCKLPYPKKFVLHTVKIGCNNLKESIAYSSFLCEWMRRKVYQMENPSLKSLVVDVVIKNNLDTHKLPQDIKDDYDFK